MEAGNGLKCGKIGTEPLFKVAKFPFQGNTNNQLRNEYLFTVTGLKKMKWFLSLKRCHFQPRVTEGHEWLEMAPREGQKLFHFLNAVTVDKYLLLKSLDAN